MRLMIECIERVGIVQDILSLLAQQGINLERIELQKQSAHGLIYLKTEALDEQIQAVVQQRIAGIVGVKIVTAIDHLPQERKNLELLALLEALPVPVLSVDLQGRIEFANQQACTLLLPAYLQGLPKRQQVQTPNLNGVALNEILVNLNRTKWYSAYLAQGQTQQFRTRQPLSHAIQFNRQNWRLSLFPIELQERAENRPLGYLVTLQSHQSLQIDLHQFMAYQQSDFDQLVAQSPQMKVVVEQAKKFALLNAPLVIQGETGTGKDVIAKACHQFGFRREQKFIAVNCAGLPKEDVESEMFGYRGQGRETTGFFEYANGGTVLLDSISELSLEMQGKLLRFLNDGSFRRVGEDKEIHVDVRVICTTQKPLSTLVSEGKIREDLYHRLNVLVLDLPPLRERLSDLPFLLDHFIQQISLQLGIVKPSYDESLLQALKSYLWPGNLRELYNCLYRACSLASDKLNVENLNLPATLPMAFEVNALNEDHSLEQLVGEFEAALLRKFYAQYPSTRKLAQRLGISHTAVANKLRTYGISK